MTIDELLAETLSLPANQRARVAREIIASLDEASDADASERWLDEIRVRAAELDGDTVKPEEWEQLRDRLRDVAGNQ
jgi:putative addiction module component (TIGR02574 family)